jgi:hypothetical protein
MNVIGDGDHKYGTKTCLKPPVTGMLRIQGENLIASPASSFDKRHMACESKYSIKFSLNIWVAGIAHGLYYGDSPTQV